MKKITFLHIVWASLLTVLFSCAKTVSEEIPEDPAPVVTGYAVSYDEAVAEVNSLLDILDVRTRGRSARRTIGDWYSWGGSAETRSDDSGAEEEPLLYVFNFENDEGFAIVSGDKRTVPVYAITESGSLYAGQEIDNPGFAIFLTGLMGDLPGGGNNPFEPPIDEGPPPGIVITETYAYGPWTDVRTYGSIIPARWGQKSPYNDLCPVIGEERAPTGCVATAAAQIMYRHEYSGPFNGYDFDWNVMRIHTGIWDYLPDHTNYPPAHPMIARLMQQLGNQCNLDMDYGAKSSGAHDEDVPRTFGNFGYSNGGTVKDYNYADLFSSVKAGKPVYVSGQAKRTPVGALGVILFYIYDKGHAWVVDAVLGRQREVKVYHNGTYAYTAYEFENLLHCNWGWDGNSDGYFYSGAFDSSNKVKAKSSNEETEEGTDGYYRYKLQMITNISR